MPPDACCTLAVAEVRRTGSVRVMLLSLASSVSRARTVKVAFQSYSRTSSGRSVRWMTYVLPVGPAAVVGSGVALDSMTSSVASGSVGDWHPLTVAAAIIRITAFTDLVMKSPQNVVPTANLKTVFGWKVSRLAL